MADLSQIQLPDGTEYNLMDEAARSSLDAKQNKLTPGTNITIENDVISATGSSAVQSDWNVTDTSSLAFIKNKPSLTKYLDKTSTNRNDIAGPVYVGSCSTNVGNAFTHLRQVTAPITGTPYNGAAFAVSLDGTASFQHKTFTTAAAGGARNAAVLRFYGTQNGVNSTGKLQFAVNNGSASTPTEDMYKDVAMVDDIPSATKQSEWDSKYTKPADGIPKTDLDSSVQTSLGKADTALQSYTETDPVFTASAAYGITSEDISNWNSKTSNVGTVTSVSVKLNDEIKGTVTSEGTIDLGTIDASNDKVTQTESTTNSAYEVLLSGSASSTTQTEGANKSANLKFNPANGALDVIGGEVYVKNHNNFNTFEMRQFSTDNPGGYLRVNDAEGNMRANISSPNGISLYDSEGTSTILLNSNTGTITCNSMSTYEVPCTITKTSGNWTVSEVNQIRSGNTIMMQIRFKGGGSSVAAGGNAFVGKLATGLIPNWQAAYLQTYLSSTHVLCQIDTEGTITVRILGSAVNLTTSNYTRVTGTFLITN